VKRTALVLAVVYLLQATWLLHAGVDLLVPAVAQATSAAADDACCTKRCGCPEEKQKRGACCCPKEEKAAKTKSAPSAFDVQKCKGVEAAIAQAAVAPAVCEVARPERDVVLTRLFELPEIRLPDAVEVLDLDKIPL
jgi:hypothetical protein